MKERHVQNNFQVNLGKANKRKNKETVKTKRPSANQTRAPTLA